jgi:hypothetical protein
MTRFVLVRSLGAMALVTGLACAPPSALAQGDSTATPTFEKAWYRGAKRPSMLSVKAYTASGSLVVSPTSVVFHSEKLELEIPLAAIRDLTTARMSGDITNDWVVVTYARDGATEVAGFKDASGFLGAGRNTVAIEDAIRRAMTPRAATDSTRAGAATPVGDGSGAAAPEHSAPGAPGRLTWQEFRSQVKLGFPDAPSTLLTDPATVGVLLVDGSIKYGFGSFGMDGIGLARVGDDTGVFRAGPVGGRGFGDVVLFTGLAPGEYVVRMARGSANNGWVALETPDGPNVHVTIAAGNVHYLGRLLVKDKGRFPAQVEKDVSDKREGELWARFSKKYAGSPWAARADARAKSLGAP